MFFKTPLFKTFAFLSLFVLFLHYLAINFYLYWQFLWFDLMVHFFGGFLVSVFFIWFLFNFSFLKNKFFISYFLLIAIVFSFVAAIIWEIFEVYFGIVLFSDIYVVDTILDIIFGVLGGIFGGFYSFNVLKNE